MPRFDTLVKSNHRQSSQFHCVTLKKRSIKGPGPDAGAGLRLEADLYFCCIPLQIEPKALKLSNRKDLLNSKDNRFHKFTMSDFEVIIYEKKDNKGYLTLNRPRP